MKLLPYTVYPSDKRSIKVVDCEAYGGAHTYEIKEFKGFIEGKTEYLSTVQTIEFVQKDDFGDIRPGLQSEQLLLMLIDRHKKLNARFPSEEGARAIVKMEEALFWLEARVKERVHRNIMGELKK